MKQKINLCITDIDNLNDQKINQTINDICSTFMRKIKKIFKINISSNIFVNILNLKQIQNRNKTAHRNAQALCENNQIYLIPFNEFGDDINSYIKLVKHEIIHALSSFINANLRIWISEGLAVYFSDSLYDYYKSVNIKKIKSIKDLETNFSSSFEDYFFSGIYICYIYNEHKRLFYKMINSLISIYDFENEAIEYFIDIYQN